MMVRVVWTPLLVFLFLLISLARISNGAKILFLSPIGSKSHQNFFDGTINVLAENGHQVTVLTSVSVKKEKTNIENIVLEEYAISKFMPNAFEANGFNLNSINHVFKLTEMCCKTLAHEKVQKLFDREFDLVFISWFFSDCYYALIHHLQVPFIGILPNGPISPVSDVIGQPHFSSFTANPFVGFTHPLNFRERFINTVADSFLNLFFNQFIVGSMEKECRNLGLCPSSMPTLAEIKSNTSAIVLNNIRTLEFVPQPYMPNLIHAGGIHCFPAGPLPKDLEEWVSGSSDNGFIYFSLGSAVQTKDMKEEHRLILLKVFGSLKQRVLWKWDQDNMKDLPNNVRISKWLPQQDLLGDHRLRLFITHGGLHSIQESIYNGIPVLGIPVMGDQMGNMNEVNSNGWGKAITWDTLSYDLLRSSILEVIGNKKMKSIVVMKSILMKDQFHHPKEEVIFWTEYILRHKGAHHLRSPILHMRWYELYNVDVWSFILFIISFGFVIFCWLLRYMIQKCCLSKRKRNKTIKKNQ